MRWVAGLAAILMTGFLAYAIIPSKTCPECTGLCWIWLKTHQTQWSLQCEACSFRGRLSPLQLWRLQHRRACPVCKGSKQARLPVFTGAGDFRGWTVESCDVCSGEGSVEFPWITFSP